MKPIPSILSEKRWFARCIVALIFNVIAGITAVTAHELRPAVMDISASQSDDNHILVELHFIAEAFLADIDLSAISDTDESANASGYDTIRVLPSGDISALIRKKWPDLQSLLRIFSETQELTLSLEDVKVESQDNLALVRETTLYLSAQVDKTSQTIRVDWDKRLGSIVIRALADEQSADYTEFLVAGGTSKPIALFNRAPSPFLDVVSNYLYSGIIHIIPFGLDHMLFVLALLAMSISVRPLLLQISLFTVAHTVTLALASLKIISFSVPLVETLIAVSIAYVGLDNLLNPNQRPQNNSGQKVGRLRAVIIFGFGLLHGLGFATVLQDFGLPEASFAVGLISFNIGVEVGQIVTILPIWVVLGLFKLNPPQFRRWFQVPVSLIILAISLFWIYERAPGIVT
jgi:hydrogenase/urease accessory protein HupE